MERILLRLGDAASCCFAVALVISVVEVLLRYAFNAPTSWVHASSTALCVAAFAVSGAYAMVRGEHMRVTVVLDRASPRWQRASRWLGALCGIVYLLGLGWGLWREAASSVWRFDGNVWRPELTPGPPNWALPAFAKTSLFIGAVLFLLAVVHDAWKLHREARR